MTTLRLRVTMREVVPTVVRVLDVPADTTHFDEHGVRLSKLPSSFRYDYDFGDGWEHDIEVLGAGGEQPGVVAGEGNCPPEDCGGSGGYARLLEVLADPQHEDHVEMRRWAGELPEFDLSAFDALVRRTVGEVPASVRMLLDLIGPG